MHLVSVLRRGGRWVSGVPLVLRFGLISALLVGTIGSIAVTVLAGAIRGHTINDARKTAMYSAAVAVRATDAKPSENQQITHAQYVETTHLLKSMVETGEFVGATAWTAPDVIVYAAEPGRIGQHEGARPELLAALDGEVKTSVVRHPSPTVPDVTERTALQRVGPLLEVWTPVRLNGKVVAAVEFYLPWKPVEASIARETTLMLLAVLAGLLVLWAGLVGIVVSASRKLRTQAAANWQLASHDALTGLANRTLLRERVERALAASRRAGRHVGLLLLDLDRFKEINDTLGHHVGDQLLQQIGPRLRSVLREDDAIARLGGDEFVVLLRDLEDAASAVATAERIGRALAQPVVLDTVVLDIEASIGIAISPDHGSDFDTLLQRADIGMYTAKASKSGVAVYAAAADSGNVRQLSMTGEIRKAIGDPGQFVLHYQPQAALLSGAVEGVEVLVRWEHPTDGLLHPAAFIPVAERTGLINPLTVVILEKALSQLQAWRRVGLNLVMAVNISARNLFDESLPDTVERLLERYDIPADQLELEITETAIMVDPERAITTLSRLRQLGVRLAVDDFGVGYSSMAYLKQLPVHKLKIDQSFVTHMVAGSADAAIVRSCIELGRNLGLTVVAEGVETSDVWHQLTQLGCTWAQGYYLSRPMLAEGFEEWLAGRTAPVTAQRRKGRVAGTRAR